MPPYVKLVNDFEQVEDLFDEIISSNNYANLLANA